MSYLGKYKMVVLTSNHITVGNLSMLLMCLVSEHSSVLAVTARWSHLSSISNSLSQLLYHI